MFGLFKKKKKPSQRWINQCKYIVFAHGKRADDIHQITEWYSVTMEGTPETLEVEKARTIEKMKYFVQEYIASEGIWCDNVFHPPGKIIYIAATDDFRSTLTQGQEDALE